MRLKELSKKLAVYTCVAALAVSGITVIAPDAQEVSAADDIKYTGESITLSDLEKEYVVTDDAYTYGGEIAANADASYKYLELTYSGEADPFNVTRFEFADQAGNGLGLIWFATWQADKFVTVDGTDVPVPTTESQTVIIDLEASGIDTSAGIGKFHVHLGDGNLTGTFTIESARLLAVELPLEFDENVISLDSLAKEYVVTSEDYTYGGEIVANASSAYKYLELTYSGEADPFNVTRFEFADQAGNGLGLIWFATWQANKFVTIDGTDVPAPTTESQTVVIDLEASGINTSGGIGKFHVHLGDGNLTGTFTIESARLLAKKGDVAGETPTEEPTEKVTTEVSSSELIILDGDDKGDSSLIRTFSNNVDGYKYCGYATFKDLVDPNYNYYLQLTYTGNILELRFEFNQQPSDKNDVPFWFNPDQEFHFVTVDGSEIPLVGDNTTVTIDLKKSDVLFADYHSGLHIHCADLATNGSITISDARLIRAEKLTTSEEATTVKEPATTKVPTTKAPTVKKPAKVVIKSATRKKGTKKAKISFKKVKTAKKYNIQICATKKFKKNVIKKTVKKINVTVTNAKLKKNKKFYVRVRAVKVVKGKTYPGPWSKVRVIKVKK